MRDKDVLWQRARIQITAKIQDAIRNLNEVAVKIVLVCGADGVLEGTISDGDIRRGLLRGLDLNSPISSVMRRKPFVVPESVTRELALQLMTANLIQQIPVVDDNGCPVGLYLWDEVAAPVERSNIMVIMAGGMGTRLRPHTENCPKPMLLVAGRPMLEHIIERAKSEGFRHFVISVYYLSHIIEEHFGDGSRLGVRIDYLKEDAPLGTAGALSLLMPRPELPFIVTNGDVMTDIRYDELLDFHARHDALGTMAVRLHEWQHPFGVVQMDGVEVVGFEEKPVARSHINAGVYALSPDVLNHLNKNKRYDMPMLFEQLQSKGYRIVAYPMHEPWLDVGRPHDLEIANQEVKSRKVNTAAPSEILV
ncbi:MAG: nucleotidyltransferase family protein [Legionellaceae bacterium]|nr:nucleotidyltransferase family protein [Legionellaceae bacterium]